MSTDKEIISIILVESFGILSFLLALVFFRLSRRIGDKQESLRKAKPSEIWNGPCYSYKWVMSNTLKPRKILEATPFLAVFAFFITWLLYFVIGPRVFFWVLGYPALVALIGVAILIKTDAFEAYSYSKAIQKAPLDHLSGEDQSYMGLAKEALEKAIIRFLILGIIFAIAGPFIPQIFDGLIYVLVMYTRIVFRATEASKGISLFLAIATALILTSILLYLPELMGRTIFRRVKLLAQRIWERWRRR